MLVWRVGARFLAGCHPVVDVSPVIGRHRFRIDAETLDCVDRLQHALDLSPALELEQNVAARTYEGQRLVGFAACDCAHDVDAPEPLATFISERGYLPRGVPLMKRILAISGQTVCRSNLTITVDGVEVGAALEHDRAGRDLPVWQGCRRVQTGEVFLMNWQVRDSLDGRYFGLISTDRIIGRAVPLWTDEDGTGRFEWRAQATATPR